MFVLQKDSQVIDMCMLMLSENKLTYGRSSRWQQSTTKTLLIESVDKNGSQDSE